MFLTEPFIIWPTLFLGILAASFIAYIRHQRRIATYGPTIEGLDRTPSCGIRFTEMTALMIMSLALWSLVLVREETGGFFMRLDALAPNRTLLYGAVAALAVVGVLIAGFIAWTGRTRFAVLLATGILAIYALHLNGAKRFYLHREAPAIATADPVIRIEMKESILKEEIQGAEIWLGERSIGKTPISMTMSAFQALVGEPTLATPERNNPASMQAFLAPFSGYVYSKSTVQTEEIALTTDLAIAVPWSQETGFPINRVLRARAELDGQPIHQVYDKFWDGPKIWRGNEMTVTINAVIPEHHKRLADLMTRLRLSDYAPDQAWFEDTIALGKAAKIALYNAGWKEPKIGPVVDALWTRELQTQYALESNPTEAQARSLFLKALEEARGSTSYGTDQPTGQLVQRVASEVDPKWLAQQAIACFPGRPFYRPRSAYQYFPLDTDAFGRRFTGTKKPDDVETLFWLHALIVAQDAWEKRYPERTSPFQNDVVTALIRWNPLNYEALEVATTIGGPVIGTYLSRHYASVDRNASEAHLVAQPDWLGFGLKLKGPAGKTFLDKNASRVLADFQFLALIGTNPADQLKYQDQTGSDSLLRPFWRSFQANYPQGRVKNPSDYFDYLHALGAEDFAREWSSLFDRVVKITPDEMAPYLSAILPTFEILPLEERLSALGQWRQQCLTKATELRNGRLAKELINLSTSIGDELARLGDDSTIANLLSETDFADSDLYKEQLQAMPALPIIQHMVAHSESRVRLLAVPILERYPVRNFRALLQKLAGDPEATVSQTATNALGTLKSLRSGS